MRASRRRCPSRVAVTWIVMFLEHWPRSVRHRQCRTVVWRNAMLSKREAGEAVRAAKVGLGVTWSQLAEAVGRPVAWTTSALLGQQPMTASQAKAAGSLLDLSEDVVAGPQVQT